MKRIIATILFAIMISISAFGEDPIKKDPATIKPFTEIVADMGERISVELPDVYDMAISVKYELSEDKKTCKAHMTVEIFMDAKTVEKISKEEVEKVVLGALEKSMKGNVAWAFFFCRVSGAKIEWTIHSMKKIIKPKEEKKKTEGENVA